MKRSTHRIRSSLAVASTLYGCIVAQPPAPPAPCAQAASATPPNAEKRSEQRTVSAPALPTPPLSNDEGMWLLNDFPSARVEQLHGFAPSEEWLEHVQLSSLRLAGGCSGSFVSGHGLVLTNHHCASRCLQQLSSARRDYMKTGFLAATEKQEVKCPEMEIDQLLAISDVTEQVARATEGRSGAAFHEALRAERARIESECATSAALRCDVIGLYHGGRYQLYRYQRFADVRLVFAPELAAAFFGGDLDNFTFPRYDLDVAFLRIYANDKPLVSPHYFRWSKSGGAAGDLTFVPGHPWHTSRELTVAQLEVLRDRALPNRLLQLAEARGSLSEYRRRGPEQQRTAGNLLFSVENSLKALKGRLVALRDPEVFGAKAAAEKELRRRVDGNPPLKTVTAGAWEKIEAAEREFDAFRNTYRMLEQAQGFWSELFDHARRLLRIAAEGAKPNSERLREYSEAQRPTFTKQVLSPSVIVDDLEKLTLTQSLTRLREELGVDNQLVARLLSRETPSELAARVVRETRLKEVSYRRELLTGGEAAIDASADPMIELARIVDGPAREVRRRYEEQVESVITKNSELIARARFAIYGTSTYPDATSTLRLSFGRILGYEEAGKPVAPFTTFARAFERATGRDPFALPETWIDARQNLQLEAPLNFCTTNDIIGGNSGSPVIDQSAHVIGVVFDGNIHSLGGEFSYEPSRNRAIAVHSSAILQALGKIYRASRVLDELSQMPR